MSEPDMASYDPSESDGPASTKRPRDGGGDEPAPKAARADTADAKAPSANRDTKRTHNDDALRASLVGFRRQLALAAEVKEALADGRTAEALAKCLAAGEHLVEEDLAGRLEEGLAESLARGDDASSNAAAKEERLAALRAKVAASSADLAASRSELADPADAAAARDARAESRAAAEADLAATLGL